MLTSLNPPARHLGLAILPVLEEENASQPVALDHILAAVATHVTAKYGKAMPAQRTKGTLAPWQEERTKDLIRTHLGSECQAK